MLRNSLLCFSFYRDTIQINCLWCSKYQEMPLAVVTHLSINNVLVMWRYPSAYWSGKRHFRAKCLKIPAHTMTVSKPVYSLGEIRRWSSVLLFSDEPQLCLRNAEWCSLLNQSQEGKKRPSHAFCIHVGQRDVDFITCSSLQAFAQSLKT